MRECGQGEEIHEAALRKERRVKGRRRQRGEVVSEGQISYSLVIKDDLLEGKKV